MKKDAGIYLRRWRQEKGFSQEDAANHVGTSQATWARWEEGKRGNISLFWALELHKKTGCPLEAWPAARPKKAQLGVSRGTHRKRVSERMRAARAADLDGFLD